MLSASQIKTYLSCQRKWAFSSLLKLPQPQSKGAQLGSEVHRVLEKWFLEGAALPVKTQAGKLAKALIESAQYPDPKLSRDQVERHFKLQLEPGLVVQGYIDLVLPERTVDHKTTSDLRYAISDLGSDVQAIIYAKATGNVAPCEWNYVQTRGAARTLAVGHRFTDTGLQSALDTIVLPPAREMIQIKKSLPVTADAINSELRPTLATCSAFGGCPYKAQCRLSRMERIQGITMGNEALAKLRARKGVNRGPEDMPKAKTPDHVEASEKTQVPEKTEESSDRDGGFDREGGPDTSAGHEPETLDLSADVRVDRSGNRAFTLYVGCRPSKTTVVYFEDITLRVTEKIQEAAQVPHWNALQYGEGKNLLVVGVEEFLDLHPEVTHLVVRFPHTVEANACLSFLMGKAAEVVM